MKKLYKSLSKHTMVPEPTFYGNLDLAKTLNKIPGCVVECGAWKGGMAAGISTVMKPARSYYLFDSFEGLPPAQEIDGEAALAYQRNTDLPSYYDNCKASAEDAEEAMRIVGCTQYAIVKGWFKDVLPGYEFEEPIALLRIDCDWYASTKFCLETLYEKVTRGGIIIFDDYFAWDGCKKAVDDFCVPQVNEELGLCWLVKS